MRGKRIFHKAADCKRYLDGIEIELHSNLPIDKQVTAMGATWLDSAMNGSR